ncbi:MAG: hypothetical protein EHM55_02500 [Acidobacteria bacterium]|nr:MAG: hypothetical protein EHM55_02500 [Acidobacteriota bacterium]
MKLIIVDRSKPDTFKRLKEKFADDLNVEVIWDRRTSQRRRTANMRGPERRSRERRQLVKPYNGKDYIVIHVAG